MSIIRKIMDQWSFLFKGKSAMAAGTQRLPKKFFLIFYCAALIISILAVYSQVLSYPRYSPEWSLFYFWNYNLSLKDIIALYNPFLVSFGQYFYRPTAFVTFYQLVTPFIDWHNIAGFQVLGVIMLAINSVFIYYFTRQLFKDEITPLLTSLLSFIHPVFFILIHNLFMTDFLYQFFLLWFCIIFCGNFLERKKAFPWIAIAMFLYLLAVTSKEQAIGLPVFLAGFLILEFLFNRTTVATGNALFRNRLVLTLMVIIITIIYIAIFLSRVQESFSSGEYRIGLNPAIIINNIVSGFLWLFHVFKFPNKTWPLFRVHSTNANNIYGLMVLAAVFYYGAIIVIRKERDEIRKLLGLLFFIAAFMMLPVYSGGRPWHFALPAVAVMMLYARFVSRLLEKARNRTVAVAALCIIVIVPMTLSAINFSRDMNRVDEAFKLNSEALLHPPLPGSSIPKGSTIAYYPAEAKWLYGCGHMFSFVYARNDINEIPVPDIIAITPEAALDLYSKANLYYFEYDRSREPRWQDKSTEFKARLLDKIPPGKRPRGVR
ncbi:MAG: hypothetical protein KA369_00775 [Spirochaetes bacterium]|nr:hypothetical protein [Spirochaetota bacterium]